MKIADVLKFADERFLAKIDQLEGLEGDCFEDKGSSALSGADRLAELDQKRDKATPEQKAWMFLGAALALDEVSDFIMYHDKEKQKNTRRILIKKGVGNATV